MREPTKLVHTKDFWREALELGAFAASNDPEPGFYKVQLTKRGAYVGVEVQFVQEICEATGELCDDEKIAGLVNGHPVDDLERVWQSRSLEAITEAEYCYLLDRAKWANWYAPEDPAANPRRSVTLANEAPIF